MGTGLKLLAIGIALGLSGCKSMEPAWALDIQFVAPDESGVRGSTTWQIYRRAWQRNLRERSYLCSVLVTFEGAPSAPDCPDCVAAMDVVGSVADSDCPDSITSNPLILSLERIGFGPIAEGGPFPGGSSAGFADYGLGWEVHGWAYPDALAVGEPVAPTPWNGSEPFAMAPSFAWPLDPVASAAPMSRSGPASADLFAP